MQGTQVQSLLRELRSHMPRVTKPVRCLQAAMKTQQNQKKKKKEKNVIAKWLINALLTWPWGSIPSFLGPPCAGPSVAATHSLFSHCVISPVNQAHIHFFSTDCKGKSPYGPWWELEPRCQNNRGDWHGVWLPATLVELLRPTPQNIIKWNCYPALWRMSDNSKFKMGCS